MPRYPTRAMPGHPGMNSQPGAADGKERRARDVEKQRGQGEGVHKRGEGRGGCETQYLYGFGGDEGGVCVDRREGQPVGREEESEKEKKEKKRRSEAPDGEAPEVRTARLSIRIGPATQAPVFFFVVVAAQHPVPLRMEEDGSSPCFPSFLFPLSLTSLAFDDPPAWPGRRRWPQPACCLILYGYSCTSL